ncbi:helix-turn-helix domain-containing protein [Nocardioides sp. GY 10127]|uniref:helix-turn-helix domain-containing protein n=1 Tax=Nocardioides sp. GY 10127 TaxID=2569762 RepID=UPI0010A7DB63|nr:helix-turn-helix domain-containing protein [Nocardioides sp. GY 10127]TIC82866.1 MerR family transcriptional regulator [Nocardioides sp. GY 10127]
MTQHDPDGGDAGRAGQDALLTLAELTERTGVSVRNVRFYTSRGLLPAPVRKGRSGYYTALHVARLELVRELQGHGFTLAAIEGYLATLPAEASADEVAVRRTMLTPWHADDEAVPSRAALEQRAGRTLDDDALALLDALGIVRPDRDGGGAGDGHGDGGYRVAAARLPVGLTLLDLGFPLAAARAAGEACERAGRALAAELDDVFRTQVWPAYRDDATPAQLQALVAAMKPVTVAGLVASYESAMDATRREEVARRTGG